MFVKKKKHTHMRVGVVSPGEADNKHTLNSSTNQLLHNIYSALLTPPLFSSLFEAKLACLLKSFLLLLSWSCSVFFWNFHFHPVWCRCLFLDRVIREQEEPDLTSLPNPFCFFPLPVLLSIHLPDRSAQITPHLCTLRSPLI